MSTTGRGQAAPSFRRSCATALRAYYMRLNVAEATEAERLVEDLAEAVGRRVVVLERQEGFVSLLWPVTPADDPDEWDEQGFAELVFFLRAWSGERPEREITVLEERPVNAAEELLRRAS